MQWSVQQDGATTGPVPQAELQQKVLQGELPFDIMIRPEGSSEEWTPIDKAIPSFAPMTFEERICSPPKPY